MNIIEQLADMTTRIEYGEDDRQEVYTLLLRAILEIKRLTYRVAVLESK